MSKFWIVEPYSLPCTCIHVQPHVLLIENNFTTQMKVKVVKIGVELVSPIDDNTMYIGRSEYLNNQDN